MNRNKKNCLCASLHNIGGEIISSAAVWRFCEYDNSSLISALRRVVAAAAFFGVTTKNVKKEMRYFVEFFKE